VKWMLRIASPHDAVSKSLPVRSLCPIAVDHNLCQIQPSRVYVSNAGAEAPPGTLALVACSRFRVEEFFEACKSHLGMAQYETRSWGGWHHHMTLVGLAHLFVTLTRLRLGKKRRA